MQKWCLDFETYLISAEMPAPKPVCLSFTNGKTTGIYNSFETMHRFLKECLEHHTIIAHNAKFELLVIYEWFKDLRPLLVKALSEGRIYCTYLHELVYNAKRKKELKDISLAGLVKHYFQEDISEDKKNPNAWRLRYGELEGIPLKEWPAEAIQYAEMDSVWAYKLHKRQRLAPCKQRHHLEADFYLNLMGNYGIEIDSERVKELDKEVTNLLKPFQEFLIDQGFMRLEKGNIKRNMKVFQQYCKNTFGKDCITTDKGIPSTTVEVLTKYLKIDPDNKIIRTYVDLMTYDKTKSAFISNLLEATELDNPIMRSQYTPCVTTGRTSSRKSKAFPSVNIQQMPRSIPNVKWDIRNCYKPRDGYKLCSIDYAGLELASCAHQLYKTFSRSEMRDTINDGDYPVDMHSKLAFTLRNLDGKYPQTTYEEFVKNKKKETFKEWRQLAKPINLGFPGGIGYDTMRTLLFKEGIYPKFKILEKSSDYFRIKEMAWDVRTLIKEGFTGARIARLNKTEFAIVIDELKELKTKYLSIYPDLRHFLKTKHEEFQTGETIRMKNEYGEWENEEMYEYEIEGFKRDWATYTAFCNGYLMQSPSAVGAKKAVIDISKKYLNNDSVNLLAFIHDEILFEIKDNYEMYIKDLSCMMIDSMQSVLDSVRITVEADLMDYWSKEGGDYSVKYWKNYNDGRLRSD